MRRLSQRQSLGSTRLISALSNLPTEGQPYLENDRIHKLRRLAEVARTCGPRKTRSEAEFVRQLKKNGKFSLELVIACVFTLWYTGALVLHLNTLHIDLMAAVRCEVPALEKHFSFGQILQISVKNYTFRTKVPNQYCNYDLRNYTDLVNKHKYNYDAIMEEINSETTDPERIPCDGYVVKSVPSIFADTRALHKHSIGEEFMLFCNESKLSVFVEDIRKIVMIISSAAIGISSDIHGRKPTFVVTSLLHLISYAIMVLPYKWGILVGRFIFGCGEPSDIVIFTLFVEKCNRATRSCMANLILIVYGVAYGTAYMLCQIMHHWRAIVLANMSMLLVLPFGIWYIVESPRWLMFTKRRAAAWKALEAYGIDVHPNVNHLVEEASTRPTIHSVMRYFSLRVYTRRVKVCVIIFTLCGVFNDISARLNKPFRFLFGWPYHLTFSLLQMVVSTVAYLLSMKVGAQKTLFTFCLTLGMVDVILMVERLEYQDNIGVFGLVLFHKTLAITIYYLIMYYVIELFPTPCRVTAVGIGMSLHWLGRIAERHIIAPLTEDSPYLNHLPAVIATVSCALAVSFLPNTQRELLADVPYDTIYTGAR